MTVAGRMQGPNPALMALKAQVRATMSKGTEPIRSSSDSRSVYVSCEQGATIDQCRQLLESCGPISQIEVTIPDKSVYKVEFESEASVELAMQLQVSEYVVVKCQSSPSRLPSLPIEASGSTAASASVQECVPADDSGIGLDDDDKEEGEVSDSEDGALPVVLPVTSAFPPRRHEHEYNSRMSIDTRRELPEFNLEFRRDSDPRRLNEFGRTKDPYLSTHGGYFAPIPPPVPVPAAQGPIFNRYAIVPPYLGRLHRSPLPSESPVFFHRYPQLSSSASPMLLSSMRPSFVDQPPNLPAPQFRSPRLSLDSASVPLVDTPSSTTLDQPNESLIAELKRKALLSKGSRTASDAKLDSTITPKKKRKNDPSKLLPGASTASAQASSDAVQFLRNVVNSCPPAIVSTPTTATPSTLADHEPVQIPSALALSSSNSSGSSECLPPSTVLVKADLTKPSESDVAPVSIKPVRKRRPRYVARNPDDPFIIHLDGNSSDETSDSESPDGLNDGSKKKRAPTSDELNRIKNNMEKLRQKIAAAEAAAGSNGAVIQESNPPRRSVSDVSKPVQTASVVPAKQNPADGLQPAKGPRTPVPARQSALQMRLSTISELGNKISSMEQRRRMLNVRLQITEQNVVRLKQMISRHDDEISAVLAELKRQQSEFNMLSKRLGTSALQQVSSDPAVAPIVTNTALVSTEPVTTIKKESSSPPTEPKMDVHAVVDSVRAQLSELRHNLQENGSGFEIISSSGTGSGVPNVRQFQYESPLTVSRTNCDPNTMVCQFALFGQCNDDNCTMMHLNQPSQSNPAPNPSLAQDVGVPCADASLAPASSADNEIIDLISASDQSASSSDEAIALGRSDPGYISLVDQKPGNQELLGSVITLLRQVTNSSAGGERYFCSSDAAISESDLEADPNNPDIWGRYCLQLAMSDRGSISDVLNALSRATTHCPQDVSLWTAQIEIARISPDVPDDQLLALARAACEANPGSETLRHLLEQLTP